VDRRTPSGADSLKGILFMTGAAIVFPVMNAIAKYLMQFYPVIEVVWARCFSHLVIVMLLFLPQRGLRLFRTTRFAAQSTLSILLFLSTAFFFWAIASIHLADATAIIFTSPFFVIALSGPMLGERVGLARWLCVVASFVGMLFIVRPGGDVAQWSALLVVASSAAYALYQIYARKVSGDAPATTVTYSAMVASLLTSLAVPFYWKTPESLFHVALFLSTGAIGALGHYLVARSLYWGQASLVSNFNYIQLIGAAALGYAMFGNLPDIWTWVGSAVIVAAGIAIAVMETRFRSARNPETATPAR
jgi:drug/metabolite transporter (DMT)-like permease